MPTMLPSRFGACLATPALLFLMGCGAEPSPTGLPTPPAQEPSRSQLTYEAGTAWDGWLSDDDGSTRDEAMVCPAQISGIGVVLYQGRVWNSTNGPYVTTYRTVSSSRYATASGMGVTFVATDGARATTNWFQVQCKSLFGIPTFDLASFAPGGWLVTYEPGSGPGGEYGMCDADGNPIDTDEGNGWVPCDSFGGGGAAGGSGDGVGTDGDGSGSGGGSMVCTQYVKEVSDDDGQTWTEVDRWWECIGG